MAAVLLEINKEVKRDNWSVVLDKVNVSQTLIGLLKKSKSKTRVGDVRT